MKYRKPISFAPGYFIDEDGTVHRRINANHPNRRQWATLKPHADKDGYLRITVANERHLVHRLVYQEFHGELQAGLVVCHLDGNRQNNIASNLAQVTQKENISHKRDHGTWQSGEKHPHAKLTNAQAGLIKLQVWAAKKSKSGRLARGEAERIALEIGVARSDVHGISRERSSYAGL